MTLTRMTLAGAALAALLAGGADANPLKAGIWQSAAVTAASQQIIGPSSILPTPVAALSQFLYLENPSATATVCISFGATATITGTACGGGEITLAPGGWRFFDTSLPTDTVFAIGSGSTGLTVGAQ